MNGHPHLSILTGLHAGASIVLRHARPLDIGSAANVGLILADTGIAPHHVTATLDGDGLALQAVGENVNLFGRTLKTGSRTPLQHGAIFRLGAVALQFSDGAPLSERDAIKAELAWLRTHAPLAWLRKRLATLPRRAWLALAIVPAVLALVLLAPFPASHPPRARFALLDRPTFRHVRASVDTASGRQRYEGYVQTPADLAALVVGARAEQGMPIVRVWVIDAMQEQLGDFLDRYYRGASAKAAEPGVFVVTPPSADAYLQPDAWDSQRIARLAVGQIDGLRALRFAGEPDNGIVRIPRIPLDALGLNLIDTPHAVWLADAKGTRYFAGSRIAIGRIVRIGNCSATVIRDDGSTSTLIASHAANRSAC